MSVERPGQMPRDEMLAHIKNGRSVLISPAFSTDKEGNYDEREPGRHVVRPEDLPGVLDTAVGDPAALARVKADTRARIESAQRELADIEKAEAEAKAKENAPAPAPTPPPAPPAGTPAAVPTPTPAPVAAPAPAAPKGK